MVLIKLAVLLVILLNIVCDGSIIKNLNDVSKTRKGKCKKSYARVLSDYFSYS